MKRSQTHKVVLAALLIGILSVSVGEAQQTEIAENRVASYPAAVVKIQTPGTARGRVWTNEDFPATPSSTGNTPEENAAGQTKADGTQSATDDPMVEQARNEVSDQMLQIAKDREKAFDGTIELVQSQLEAEQDEFRMEVYREILQDTLRLKEINKHVLEQFGKKEATDREMAPGSTEVQTR